MSRCADLLGRLDRVTDAVVAYDGAIARTDNASEREFLQRKRALGYCGSAVKIFVEGRASPT